MDVVSIPAAVFESPAFLELSYAERCLLLQLYHARGDCERFLVDADLLTECGYPTWPETSRRINRLVESGFITSTEKQIKPEGVVGRRLRVYQFVHQVLEAA
jgi:hypothetical protein